ncbi:uracil-DNA glycosylase [Dyadobacter psychrotolerans]|uniref:Uracil-DNA glycosylase n=1 Tax=Dyadobacter psychrotolerans TaxID=2541721 RepID=A0A4R5E0S4_9BACT|nr:uracil-DNA glycosylase [Dyadobacter psychrotolerans]TDE17405.1 uracil-DNA glycosylase [Dyadobacter psychrotolerans]
MDVKIEESWKTRLSEEFEKPYFVSLTDFVKEEYKSRTIYPSAKQIFNAFNHCSFDNCRVVILGQDPYHGAGQANGLCFSVNDGIRMPPSLINIFKEVENDLDKTFPKTGNLERWASQGVLLLNATLTVQAGAAGSHQNRGWERFTDAVIKCVSDEKENVVFLLWGKYAQDKGAVIDASKHFVLKSKHPSPMSANSGGWFGNHHFSKANAYLQEHHLEPVNW